jgi:DNA-binding NarL/FixJ family response regulator
VTLLVDKPGYLRDAVEALVAAVPGYGIPVLADSVALALALLCEVDPGLVLIGSGLAEAEIVDLLRKTKQARPGTGCLVLADSPGIRRAAGAAGADRVVSLGLPAGSLYATIEEMLENHE